MQEHLEPLGFKVISIERGLVPAVWRLRLKATLQAQAHLLLGRTYRARTLSRTKLTEHLTAWLKAELRSLLVDLGRGKRSGKLVVAGRGACFEANFVLPVGSPGLWRPTWGRAHPFRVPGIVQDWLKPQRN